MQYNAAKSVLLCHTEVRGGSSIWEEGIRSSLGLGDESLLVGTGVQGQNPRKKS